MKNFSLFCKSYKRDLKRCAKLSKSIKKYNKDNLPFYVSVPREDIPIFKDTLEFYTEIIPSEDISDNNNGWLGQQIVKAEYSKLDISKYYLVLDSDSYFFKDFYLEDFMYKDDVPYMVMHENVEFFEWMDRYDFNFHFDYRETHIKEYRDIMNFLDIDRKKIYHYAPCPYIWNSEVWKLADKEFGIKNLLKKRQNELKWYGELTHYYNKSYMACGPLFKCLHYQEQYKFYKQCNFKEETFKKQYMGIVMQSNWGAPLNY